MSEGNDFREPVWRRASDLNIPICSRCGARLRENETQKCGSCLLLAKVMAEREQEQTFMRTLHERMQYLGFRVEAKQKIGWQFDYDERERAALEWALNRLGYYA
jgi:ribosomal protein L40E